jgi:hypothetical protein
MLRDGLLLPDLAPVPIRQLPDVLSGRKALRRGRPMRLIDR